MNVPIDKIAGAFKAAGSAKKDSDVPVRVSVFVDGSASTFLLQTVREALVPQTTSAIVRVERLGEAPVTVKPDTDVSIVISCGSEHLQQRVQEIVIGGAPTVVLAESAVEVGFIQEDTPMLGLVAATNKTYLLESLARWILDRTEKDTAFAANFPFMRVAAANRIILNASAANLVTGALLFVPGADFPVMAVAQLGMMAQLALVFGKPVRPERGYEVAGVLVAGLLMRALARAVVPAAGHLGFVVKALVAGFGTYAMGRALTALYEADVDYTRANQAVASAARHGRDFISLVSGRARAADPADVAQAA